MINFIKILGITAEVNTKILVLMLQYNGGQEIFIFTFRTYLRKMWKTCH